MEITEVPCSPYSEDDGLGPHIPCKCPRCGAFLKWDNLDETPVCNKCGVELVVIPDVDEDTGETLSWGKICPTGNPKSKAIRGEELKVKRQVNAGRRMWKAFL